MLVQYPCDGVCHYEFPVWASVVAMLVVSIGAIAEFFLLFDIFLTFSAYLILMDDHAFPAHSRGPSPWCVPSNIRMAGGGQDLGESSMCYCGRLCCTSGHCIWHINHGYGDVMVHSFFDVDEVEHFLHTPAHFLREV